jgi:hypothetical protein
MVLNPEKDRLSIYDDLWSTDALSHGSVERLVTFSLEGDLKIHNKNVVDQMLTRTLLEDTEIDEHLDSAMRTAIIYGDSFNIIRRNAESSIERIIPLDPKNVEINTDTSQNIDSYEVKIGPEGKYSKNDIIHIQFQKQQDSPYGLSMMKGIESYVEKEDEINAGLLKALRGENPTFDSEGNLRILKALPLLYSRHFGVPVGYLTVNFVTDEQYYLEKALFGKRCQQFRDTIRNELMQKVISPEVTRLGLSPELNIGWRVKERPLLKEIENLIAMQQVGAISIDEFKIKMGMDYYFQ